MKLQNSLTFNEFSIFQPDGTLVTQVTDFRTQSQIVRLIIPGEEELGEPRAQTLCFINSFTGDLIAPEAVMKLRQKNPKTVRLADDDLGEVVQDSPLKLTQRHWPAISSHLASLCKHSVFSSEHELHNIIHSEAKVNNIVGTSSDSLKSYEKMQRCFSAVTSSLSVKNLEPCICSRQVWFNWFPCSLKYCRNRDGGGEHRCGIKTCQKTMTYRYPTRSKLYCLWDEP